MSGAESISLVVANIYDAALDSLLWPTALGIATDYIGGPNASLLLRHQDPEVDDRAGCGGPNHWKISVFCARQENWPSVRLTSLTIQDLASHAVVLSSHESLKSWLKEAPASIAQIAIYHDRGDSSWDETARHRLELLTPHICRALQIGKAIEQKTDAFAMFAEALDGLKASIFLVNETGRIVHANTSGHSIVADGGLVRCVKGRITIDGVDAISPFGEAPATEYGPAEPPSIMNNSEVVNLSRGSCSVVHTFRINAHPMTRKACDRRAVAGVILEEVRFDAHDAIDRMVRHYGLARRERQILEAVIEGYGQAEIAAKLAIGPGTAKTYFIRLHRKTGTKHLIDLINLCSAFRSPFLT